jgi:alpha-2-macroglobulin
VNRLLRGLEKIVGSFSWNSPPWLSALGRCRKDHPSVFWGRLLLVLMLIAGGVAGTLYTLSLPGSVLIKASIEVPGLTSNEENAKPQNLIIEFAYDLSDLKPEQEHPEGVPSMARIDLVDKVVKSGIILSPALPGQWHWQGDRTLVFEPQQDWPAGTEFTLTFDKTLFVEEARFKRLSYPFVTPAFTVTLGELEFYQDPRDRTIRKVVSTLVFSHPVDKENLEHHLTMSMRPSGAEISAAAKNYAFTVSYDRNQREAYVHSEPLTLPEQPNYMTLAVGKGIRPAIGGRASDEEISKQILIPDIYSFLKVKRARMEIVRNEKEEPQQLLSLQFTDEIAEAELLGKLSVFLLPERNRQRNSTYWESPREVTEAVLREAEPLDLNLVPNEQGFSKIYNFIFDVLPGRTLYAHIQPGLVSVSKFVQSTLYDTVLRLPDYPKELSIMGDGSMLSLSGAHQLSLLARGLEAVRVHVGKLLPGQLNHLVSQTSGDIKDPYFNDYRFDQNNLAEFQQEIIGLKPQHPKTANYASFDLTAYLPEKTDRFGLFFVRVAGWDKKRQQEIYGAADKRLILVTDLGLLVKNNADQSHDLFVQSIRKGTPVAGARVELLGRNGVPLFTRTTTDDGHVQFPSTKGFKAEQAPNVYIVKTASDTSFIPFERSSRRLNYSHYDVGGVRSLQGDSDHLNAFLFSDRGIYRPGELVEIGGIVKDRNLGNVEGIPFEIAITGPRGNETSVKKINLPKKGFFDYPYTTDPTSDTGTYQVALYLVRNGNYRGRMLGSTNFRVEEFQPDTLKIESMLVDVKPKGWTSEPSLKARIRLNNLFGIPAQERKVTGRMSVRATNFSFKEYPDYNFVDPYYDPKKQRLQIDEELKVQKTDAEGIAWFTLPLERFDGGTYLLSFTAEGFEPGGGRSVWARNSALISPLSALVGYKSDGKLSYITKDAEQSIELLAIGSDLQPRAMANLRGRLVEVQHISTLVQQRNGTFKYQSVEREKELRVEPLVLGTEGLSYRLPTEMPGDYLLEVLDAADLRLARIRFSVVGHGNLLGRLEKSAELNLKLSKTDYRAGELVEMNITAPYTGAGLITIESDRVHTYKWFRTDSNSTVETIRIPAELEGSAYINVTFVRDAGSEEIFTSPLSYAVAPFTIDRSKRRLDVQLGVDSLVRPGKTMDIRYSTSAPSRIVVFAVDEGILQVAGYQTPKPLDHFLRKRALEVDTLQILDLILPEFALVREVSAAGGGSSLEKKALAKNLNPFARKLDQPAVFWSGIVDADGQERTLSFTVPDTFAGKLRVMAVAVAAEAIGAGERSTLVRGPFVLTPSVLTQAAPGDRFKVSLGVANIIEGSGSDVPVAVRIETSEHLEVVGEKEALLSISEGSEKMSTFEVRVKDRLGPAEVTFFAAAGDEQGHRSAGLSIRPALPYRSSFVSGYEKDGAVDIDIARRLYPDLSEQKAVASAGPLVLVDGLSSYLEHFPHGCTEQVVSQVFPLVGLMSHPAFQPHGKDNRARFEHLISKLRERQLSSGGFSFWPGGRSLAEFPSVYVMHFLLESQELGYPVPVDLMARGKDFLQAYVGRDADSLESARVRACAIYLLTRMGEVTTNSLVHLQTALEKDHPKEWKKDLTAVYMAAAYRLLQKEAVAVDLVNGYRIGSGGMGPYSDFHSPLTLDAQYLYLLSLHFADRIADIDGEQILRLIEPIFRGRYNTLASAYTILALGAYSKQIMDGNFAENVRFSAFDSEGKQQGLPGEPTPFATASFPVDSTKVIMAADRALFYLISQSGFDRTLPTSRVREGLEISREYLDEDGNEVNQLEQGREVSVRLRVRALGKGEVSNVAVIDLLPGGFEIIRSSVPRTAYNWRADYVDVREDRVVFYGSFDSSVKELNYRAKVTAAGSFTVPPAVAESMYDRAVRAVSLPRRFDVIPSQ